MCTADGQGLGSVAEALRMTRAGLDYLNGPGAGELDAAACGSVLRPGSTPLTRMIPTGTAPRRRG